MDSLIGLIIFVVIAFVFNAARKYQENQQQARRESEPRLSREDLPETVRRMLYGEEIPTAEPVEAAPAEAPAPAPAPRPVPQRRVTPKFPDSWGEESEARRAAREATQTVLRRKQERARRRRVVCETAGGPAAGESVPVADTVPRPTRPRQGLPYGQNPVAGLFCDLDAVRKGIVMSEILGLPRSLRDA